MSVPEGAALLLQHLQLDAELASEDIRQNRDKVARRLGYLVLAIDLAGAYRWIHKASICVLVAC